MTIFVHDNIETATNELICWHVLYIKYEFSIRHQTEVSFDEGFNTISHLAAKRKAESAKRKVSFGQF